MYFDHRLN